MEKKILMFLNDEEQKRIEGFTNDLFKDGRIPKEGHEISSGGLGIKVDYVDDNRVEVNVFRNIGYITITNFNPLNKRSSRPDGVKN